MRALAGRCVRSVGAMMLLAAMMPEAWADVVDEAKIGVLAHDVAIFGRHVESGADFVGEVLFTSPDFLRVIGAPRPTVGGSVNTDGRTNYAYLDMTWTAIVWQAGLGEGRGVYVGGFVGGAVHDGRLGTQDSSNKDLGTRALYHLGVEAGFRLTPVSSIELYFSHLSNGDASSHNPGLNNVGLRAGFRF